MSNKTAPKPIVYIYPRAYHLMSLWSKLGGDKGQEFTCLGRAQLGAAGDVFVTDAWLVRHEGNGGAVEADDDDINELIFDNYAKGIEPQELRVWVHSHPGHGPSATYLSGTDESNINRFMTGEWLISIVFDERGGNPYTRIDFKNPRASVVADLQIHYFLSEEDQTWAKEIFKEKAAKKVGQSYPSQHKGGTNSGYPAYQGGYQGARTSHTGGKGNAKGKGDGKGDGKNGARAGIDARAGNNWGHKTKSQKKAERKADRKAQQQTDRKATLNPKPVQAGQKGSVTGDAPAEKKEGDAQGSSIVHYPWANTAKQGNDYYTGLDEDYADWDWNSAASQQYMTKRELDELALNCVVYLDSIGQRVLENDITIEAGIEEIQELGFLQGDAEELLEIRTGGAGTTQVEKARNDAEEMGPVERMEAHLREGFSTESLVYGHFDDDDYSIDAIPWHDRVLDLDAEETREMFLKSESARTVEEGKEEEEDKQEVIGFEYIPHRDKDDDITEAWEQLSEARQDAALYSRGNTLEFDGWEKLTQGEKDILLEKWEEARHDEEERQEAEDLDDAVMVVLDEMHDELNELEVEHERANPYFGVLALYQMAWDSISEKWEPLYMSFWKNRGHSEVKSRALTHAWRGLTELVSARSFQGRNDEALRIARYWLNNDEGVVYADGKPVDADPADEVSETVTPSQLAAQKEILINDDDEISREAGRMWICPRSGGGSSEETWHQREARRQKARDAAKAEVIQARLENRYDPKKTPWVVASDIAIALKETTIEIFDLINETPGAELELCAVGLTPERLQTLVKAAADDRGSAVTAADWAVAESIASHADRYTTDVHKQMTETPWAIIEARAGTLTAARLDELVRKEEARQHEDSLDAKTDITAYTTETDVQYVAQAIAAETNRKTSDVLLLMRTTPEAIEEARAGKLTVLRLEELAADHHRRLSLFAENGPMKDPPVSRAVSGVIEDAVPTPIVDDTEKMLITESIRGVDGQASENRGH